MHHYNTSGSACITQAGLGEIAIGIAFSHDILAKGTAAGYPIKGSFRAKEPVMRLEDWEWSREPGA